MGVDNSTKLIVLGLLDQGCKAIDFPEENILEFETPLGVWWRVRYGAASEKGIQFPEHFPKDFLGIFRAVSILEVTLLDPTKRTDYPE